MSMIFDNSGIELSGGYAVGGRKKAAGKHKGGSMIYDNSGIELSGGYPVGGNRRRKGGNSIGGVYLGGAPPPLYRELINLLGSVSNKPQNQYIVLKDNLHKQLGRKPTISQMEAAVRQFVADQHAHVEPAHIEHIIEAPAKARKKYPSVRGSSVKTLQARIGGLKKKLTKEDRHAVAHLLKAHGAGPLSAIISALGLGDDMHGGAWYDDVLTGFKKGVEIGAPLLPFILA